MRILVTGSKGLIGSALVQALKNLSLEVIGIDKRASEQEDILDVKLLNSIVRGVHGIIHLAAVSRVIQGEKDPELCWKTNVEGTENIVQAALSSPSLPWVIYASSREVYGEQEVFPVKESAPLSPVNIYGKSKLAAENIIEKAREKGLKATIVRFSNVFGNVNDYPDRVVPAFCRAAVLGEEICVEGEGNLFDFTYLEDVIQGLLSLIHQMSKKGASLSPVHFTTGIATSLGEIADIAQKASSYVSPIVQGTPRSFDVMRFWGDTSRAKEVLNWTASTSIEEGMHHLISQYRIFL